MFAFYFKVTNTPLTTVTCSVNNNTFNTTEKELPDISTDSIRVGVAAFIRKEKMVNILVL